jgi:hypothetical protein
MNLKTYTVAGILPSSICLAAPCIVISILLPCIPNALFSQLLDNDPAQSIMQFIHAEGILYAMQRF